MRCLLSLLFLGLLAMPASAQWYARGDWTDPPFAGNDYPLIDTGDGVHYTGTVSGLFPEFTHEYKVSNEDFSISAPTDNGRVKTDINGEITFHFFDQETWEDGWFPNNERRVGWEDTGLFDWEIAGNFNSYNGGEDWYLTDQGNGLHTGSFAMPEGLLDFKFRQRGSWDIAIGSGDFSYYGGNNEVPVVNEGDIWNFELDLPNGRWRAYTDAVAPGQPGDHNQDGFVDAADYVVWRKTDGGNIAGYEEWRANFGAGPAWVATGTFGNHSLIDQGNGQYTASITGLMPETDYEFKVAREDFSQSVPGTNIKVRADSEGEVNLNFFELQGEAWTDGWNPANEHRVGYEDHDLFDWEVIGEFNNWPGSTDPNFVLTDQGNGLHTGQFTFAMGEYEFKFRHVAETNPWNVSIGDNFGNSAANNMFTVESASETWAFELDLPNGRWRAYMVPAAGSGGIAVPEPATLALVALGAALALGGTVRRR